MTIVCIMPKINIEKDTLTFLQNFESKINIEKDTRTYVFVVVVMIWP